jgi:hypothetical protein
VPERQFVFDEHERKLQRKMGPHNWKSESFIEVDEYGARFHRRVMLLPIGLRFRIMFFWIFMMAA